MKKGKKMNTFEETTEFCSNCDKKIAQNDSYTYEGKIMCDDCAMKAGLFPLGQIGASRDKISERGRYRTIPKP